MGPEPIGPFKRDGWKRVSYLRLSVAVVESATTRVTTQKKAKKKIRKKRETQRGAIKDGGNCQRGKRGKRS